MNEVEEYSILQKKFREWFEKTVPADMPLPAEIDHFNHRKRRRPRGKFEILVELLGFGFSGAVFFEAVVGIVIVILYLNYGMWYSDTWPFVIFLAMMLGFIIGVSKGFVSQQREKYFYKG
jgi:hypothetical protein